MPDLDLSPGAEYDFAPWSLRNVNGQDVSGRWPQGRYRILGTCQAVPVFQRQVVYVGVGGPDDGLWYCCSPADFCTKFLPVEAPPRAPDPPAPERVIDQRSTEGSQL